MQTRARAELAAQKAREATRVTSDGAEGKRMMEMHTGLKREFEILKRTLEGDFV